MAVIVKVADDGYPDAELIERVDYFGHGGGSVLRIHGDADEFRAGAGEGHRLVHGGRHVGRVGVGHRLHDDGVIAADFHTSDFGHNRLTAVLHSHAHPPGFPILAST